MYVSFKVGLKKYCTNGCGHSLPFEYVCFGLSMVPKLLCVACMPDSYKYVELAIFESKRGKLDPSSQYNYRLPLAGHSGYGIKLMDPI